MHDLLASDRVIERCLALGAEDDNTFFHSKEGIILSDSDVGAWEDICTALTDDDLTYESLLAMIDLDPQILRI